MKNSLFFAMVSVVALFASHNCLFAQTTTGTSESRFSLESKDLKADAPVMKDLTARKSQPRLPNYYSSVVTEKQRDDIRAIQNQYLPLIDILTTRLDALRAEMNGKVKAVLSEEQVAKVEKQAEDSRLRRRNRSTTNAAPQE